MLVNLDISEEKLLQLLQTAFENKAAEWMASLPKPEPVKYYSVIELKEITGHCRTTIVSWIEKGKVDRKGNPIKLPALQFVPGHYRIKLSDLEAFGKTAELHFKQKHKVLIKTQ